ncbi:MAG TPA: methyltransferase domain-containing protein [Thermomicrobiales bacterium]|nr:methyltransferase domain-containing protein [Thermomicrobiales bacterium]
MATGQDRWAEWLLHRRHGGDAAALQHLLSELRPIRDAVLAHARIAEGDVVLDVGAGDGLIAFGAIERVGPTGAVIFSDISRDLLDHARALAEQLGVADRCRFLRAPADDLGALADRAVDVVTTRSVLIYVENQAGAFREFFRVLRSGGRLSIYEPINRFGWPEPPGRLLGADVTPLLDIAAKVRAVYHRHQPPETDTMMTFDERDLLSAAEGAGFGEIHLELRADIAPLPAQPWDTFAQIAFNPRMPTFEEALAEAVHDGLAWAEAERLVAHIRPQVEAGQLVSRLAVAYLWASKR